MGIGDKPRRPFLSGASASIGARLPAPDVITPDVKREFDLGGPLRLTRFAVTCHMSTALPGHADEMTNFYSSLNALKQQIAAAPANSDTPDKLLADLQTLKEVCSTSDDVIINLLSSRQKPGAEPIHMTDNLRKAAATAFDTVIEHLERAIELRESQLQPADAGSRFSKMLNKLHPTGHSKT